MKHNQRHQISIADPDGAAPGSALGERAVILFVFISLVAGIGIGYLLRGIMSPTTMSPSMPPVTQPGTSKEASSVSFDSEVEPLEAALKTDPQNAKILIELGNLYYDHRAYSTATAYYQRALKINPGDVNARTDLGTAYAYSGLPQQAVAEYQKALAIAPRHFRTLFNLGVVYDTGLKDPARAIATWQKLLKLYPRDPNRNQVESLIQSAKREVGGSATAR